VCRAGDDRDIFRQPLERRAIEVIEVRVRDEDQVELGQLAERQRRRHVALWTAGRQSQAQADAVRHDRVGEDVHVTDAEQHGGVADPGGGEVVRVPARQGPAYAARRAAARFGR
jgi:hypothetical protein